MRNVLLLLLILSFASTMSFANADSVQTASVESDSEKKDSVSYTKLAIVGSAVALTFGASYWVVFNHAWWGEKSDFHFETDLEYALNLDKVGHFYSGVVLAHGFYDGLRWAGVSEGTSWLWGGILSSLTHVGIDIKDGFAKEWGYSVYDVVSGSIGGFYPYLQYKVPVMQHFDIKMSHWKNSDTYMEAHPDAVFSDDYANSTFWLAVHPALWRQDNSGSWWPDWLTPAIGLSIDEEALMSVGKKGDYQVYLSLDYSLRKIFKPKSVFWKKILRYLDYWKFPSPSFQVYPWKDRAFHLAYPIIF